VAGFEAPIDTSATTAAAGQGQVLTFVPVADAPVQQSSPTTNYGSSEAPRLSEVSGLAERHTVFGLFSLVPARWSGRLVQWGSESTVTLRWIPHVPNSRGGA
jgi:hypothetical protein